VQSNRFRTELILRHISACHNKTYWSNVWRQNVVVIQRPPHPISGCCCRRRHAVWANIA